jgi:DNA-binding CsgD family transcriptional regulator
VTRVRVKPRAEKKAEAQRLRAEGLTVRKIAERMGSRPNTVSTWLTDPDLSKQRARRLSYQGTCEECGAKTDGSNGAEKAPTICLNCSMESRSTKERDEQIRVLWEWGVPSAEIGAKVGLTAAQVRGAVNNLRHRHGAEIAFRQLPKGGEITAQRYALIAELVRDGLSNAEVGEVLGTSAGSVSYMICRARKLGYDMPCRSGVAA